MQPGIHEQTGEYCPYCGQAMLKVIATGHQFCSNTTTACDYHVTANSEKPVSAEQQYEIAITEQMRQAYNTFCDNRLLAIREKYSK